MGVGVEVGAGVGVGVEVGAGVGVGVEVDAGAGVGVEVGAGVGVGIEVGAVHRVPSCFSFSKIAWSSLLGVVMQKPRAAIRTPLNSLADSTRAAPVPVNA